MTIELQRKRNWDDISFDICYRFGIACIIWFIVAGILALTGGMFEFTDGDGNAVWTITTGVSINVALICLGISIAGFAAPIIHACVYEYVLKKEESECV